MVNVTIKNRAGGILATFKFHDMDHYFEFAATAQLTDGSYTEEEIYSIIVERTTK